MKPMYKIAVLGDRDSVLGFMALGLDVYPVDQQAPVKARETLHRLAREDYAVIYITEQLARELEADVDRYKDEVTPAIILIPGKAGSLGIGSDALQKAVERAVGADIL